MPDPTQESKTPTPSESKKGNASPKKSSSFSFLSKRKKQSISNRKKSTDIRPPRNEKIARPAHKDEERAKKQEQRHKKKEKRIKEKAEKQQQKQSNKKPVTKLIPPKGHWKYFPVMLAKWERQTFLFAVLLIIVGAALAVFTAGQSLLTPLPDNGGTYTEGILGQPSRINPVLLTKDADRDLAQLMYSGLLRYDHQQQLQPDLAESYEVTEEGKSYTFHLRQDAVWNDNEPVTADDVVFTVQLIQDPEITSPRLADFQSVEVEKVDDFTVKFNLTKDAFIPFLRENTTFGIMPKHVWQDTPPAQIPLSELNLKVTGSGPFEFVEFRKDNESGLITSYTLKRNKKYYDQKAYLDELTFKYYSNSESLFDDFEKGKIDGIHTLSPTQLASIPENQQKKWQIHTLQLPSYFAIFFNQTQNDALKDDDVRRALGKSLDRQRIVDDALKGEARVTDAPILPSFLGFNPDIARLEHNDDEAKTLLDEAGWEQAEGSDFRTKGEEELTIQVTMPDHDPFPRVAEIITEEWESIGVHVEIIAMESTFLRTEKIRPREYEALLFGQSIAHDPDPYPFWHSTLRNDPGLNLTSYKNPTVDDLLETARQESDEEVRIEKYVHFQNELTDDLPAIFLYIPTYTYALDKDMKGVELSSITFPSDRFSEANFWYKDVKWRYQKTETVEENAPSEPDTTEEDAPEADTTPEDETTNTDSSETDADSSDTEQDTTAEEETS